MLIFSYFVPTWAKENLENIHSNKANEIKGDIDLKKMVITKEEALWGDNLKNHEKNRMGNGVVGTLMGNVQGVGRPNTQTIPEFEPMMNYYGSSKQISSIDGNQAVKPPSGVQGFSPEAAKSLIQDFKPDNTRGTAATNDGQHVDASKKIKG